MQTQADAHPADVGRAQPPNGVCAQYRHHMLGSVAHYNFIATPHHLLFVDLQRQEESASLSPKKLKARFVLNF